VLKDLNIVSEDEPFYELIAQGMVNLGGTKMSKSKGNVVNPLDMIDKYGADTTRLFILFAAPPEKDIEWSDEGIQGCYRFLNRVYNIYVKALKYYKKDYEKVDFNSLNGEAKKVYRKLHQTIKKATHDIENRKQFNTAVSSYMEFFNMFSPYVNSLEKRECDKGDVFVIGESLIALAKMLAPFTPHIGEELYRKLGYENSIFLSSWPEYKEEYCVEDSIQIPVMVNGKLRDKVEVSPVATEEEIKEKAFASEKIKKWVDGKEVKKVIYVKGKILNIVVK
jgi:leucyl-tRNA synthetase